MAEEQLEEKMEKEENKVLIILGSVLGVIWILLFIFSDSGFMFFLYGLINIGVFLIYIKAKSKKSQGRWVKSSLFEEKEKE
ncbi:MAG: hypothetical protein ACTSWX_14000 [Promethearchaeota archaeon]